MKFTNVSRRGSEYIVGSHENATVKIYTSNNKVGGTKYENHCLTYSEGGQRVRKRFSDLDEAKAEASRVLIAMANGATKAITLNNSEAEAYALAAQTLKPTGINLLTAAREYRHAFDALGGNGWYRLREQDHSKHYEAAKF